MAISKYARFECERRWLVRPGAAPSADLARGSFVVDLYVANARLRVRAMTPLAGGDAQFKLGKKFDSAGPVARPFINIDLSVSEYEVLMRLPGARIEKTRHRVIFENRTFAIDEFCGTLEGLALTEAEAETREAALLLPTPPWALCEVTEDAFFSGGVQAHASRKELAARLSAKGIALRQ